MAELGASVAVIVCELRAIFCVSSQYVNLI